ncbi:MAG: tRNA epoxyqueuosine(34) reductase QueG, partial [Kiritimatiellaeota bacterium]|nr:tRNA epoxyqueuosine(34) reductase QueG [Kiritimatiellota bacterium]
AEPARRLAGAKSIVCVALAYGAEIPPPEFWDDPLRGRVARFAWGPDYHALIAPRLEELARFIERDLGRPLAWKVAVDSAPILERDHAARAGLGYIGKSNMLIAPRFGPMLLLGELLLDVELDDYDAPLPQSCCAETACATACPTGALTAPYRLDARRCISWLTIENKGEIPEDLRPNIGRWIFGCDECQTNCHWSFVSRHLSAGSCPLSSKTASATCQQEGAGGVASSILQQRANCHSALEQPNKCGRRFQPRESNRNTAAGLEAPPTGEPAAAALHAAFRFQPEISTPRLDELLALDERAFRERFDGTPLARAKRRGLRRNAAVALGNSGADAARPPLERAATDPDEMVREHVVWALHRLAGGAGP